jgi:hypothetical protein
MADRLRGDCKNTLNRGKAQGLKRERDAYS